MTIIYDANYGEMSAAAQRRPAAPLGSPSLAWHRAFWKPDNLSGRKWRQRVDRVLFWLYMYARYSKQFRQKQYDINAASDVFPNLDNRADVTKREVHLFNTRYEIQDAPNSSKGFKILSIFSDSNYTDRTKRKDRVSFTVDVFGCQVTVQAELHHEYWSLTVLADFSKYKFEQSRSPTPLPLGFDPNLSVRGIKKFLDQLQQIAVARSENPGERDKRHSNKLVMQKELLIGKAKWLLDHFILSEKLPYASTGGVFSDCFGIILGLQFDERGASRRLVVPPPVGASVLNRIAPSKSFKKTRVHYLVDAIWPLIRYAQFDKQSENNYGKPEYTLSLFQRKRLLYVSALGRVTPSPMECYGVTDGTVKIDPIIYFMFPVYQNRWQLGRVVEQMNNLTVWRIASVRSLYGLALSSRQIGEIRRGIAAGEYRNAGEDELWKNYEQIGTDGPDDMNRTNYISGGLQYRVGRSKYYFENFQSEIHRLAISRVEGFPPFDQFVGRRLNETHQFIKRTGELYEELTDRIRLEGNFARNKRSADLQTHIDANTKLAVHFLENAERILLIPLTYYVGATLHYSHEFFEGLGGFLMMVHRHTPLNFGQDHWTSPASKFLSSCAMLIGLACTLWVLHDLRRRNKELLDKMQSVDGDLAEAEKPTRFQRLLGFLKFARNY